VRRFRHRYIRCMDCGTNTGVMGKSRRCKKCTIAHTRLEDRYEKSNDKER
jgi:hypothetical protein